MCRVVVALPIVLVLLAPSPGSAQQLQAFQDLAPRIKLNDRLQIEDQSGARITGRLARLTSDEIAIQTNVGEQRFTSADVRSVAVRHGSGRWGALIGAGVGAVVGAALECGGGEHEYCSEGVVMLGIFGTGVGAAVGAFIPRTTTVYRTRKQAFASPVFSRRAIGVVASLRW
jgi:hypothetical protein